MRASERQRASGNQLRRQYVLWPGNAMSVRSLRSSVMVRPAGLDARTLHVRLRDDSVVPALDELRSWLDAVAVDPDITTIRTSALFPRTAARFQEAGFTVADTLALLRADLGAPTVRAAVERHDGRWFGDGTATMRRSQFPAASRVDRAAFGERWAHDAAEIDEICRATPTHRARWRPAAPRRSLLARHGGELVAFAIAGAATDHGYLQRLAVDPARQRRGHGRALTVDALRWMVRRRLPDCLVNTSEENAPALALYDSLGFTAMPDRLRVLTLDVSDRR
jgi:ribosomal protein S18 acetylase RimI-like enzyme